MADADEVKARLRARIAAIENSGGAGRAAEGDGKERAREHTARMEPRLLDLAEDVPDSAHARELCSLNTAESDEASESERAFRKIERLASGREQASVALRRRLAREGFSQEAVEESLARALSCGLVDDMRFADVLVRSRLSQGRGRQGIAAELADLGIEPDEVEALADSEEGDEREVERALAVLKRKPPRAKNAREAAYRRLMQKGYGASAASTAARLWSEAQAGGRCEPT